MSKTRSQRIKDYNRDLVELRHAAAGLVLAIDNALPADLDPLEYPEFANVLDEPLHSIANRIDDALSSFDRVQASFGRSKAECRHTRFLAGK